MKSGLESSPRKSFPERDRASEGRVTMDIQQDVHYLINLQELSESRCMVFPSRNHEPISVIGGLCWMEKA